MPQLCTVRGCKSVLRKNSGISFHGFPKKEHMRQLWLNALRLNALKWDHRPRVCSKHFKKEDFVFGGNVTKLNKFAIPSLLPSSSELQKKSTTSTATMEYKPIVSETLPANCTSASHYRVKAAISTKHQRRPPKFKVTRMRTLKSEATGNSIDSAVMLWSADQPNQAEDNRLNTSTPQMEKNSTEICSSLKTIEALKNEVAYLKQENKRLQLLLSSHKPLLSLQNFSANNDKNCVVQDLKPTRFCHTYSQDQEQILGL